MPTAIGVGVIGLGWMGRLHSEAYLRMPFHFPDAAHVRLKVAADPEVERRRAAIKLGFEQSTHDWAAVIEHPGVDAVSITTPNDLHCDIARYAAAHGKHLWIEKPVGRSIRETREISEAVAGAGVASMVGLDFRFVPVIEQARLVVSSGELGQLTSVRGRFLSDFGCDAGAPRTWRYMRDRAGHGVLGDLMMHLADLLAFIVGPVDGVLAAASTVIPERPDPDDPTRAVPVENEDRVISLLGFEGGLRGQAEVSRVAAGHKSDVSIEINGTRGSLSWTFTRMNELRVYPGEARDGDRGVLTLLAGPSHGAYGAFQPAAGLPMGYDDLKVIQAHAFCDAIVRGRACAPDVEDALRTAHVLTAMERSWTGQQWEAVVAS